MARLYFYLWFVLKLTLVTGLSPLYVLKGREFILTPAVNKPPDDILWKHNEDKVITFDGTDERVFEPYHGRVTLSRDTATLTISDIRYEDSGEYVLDAIIGVRLHRSQYMLKVLDEVSKPVIRCEMNSTKQNSTITSATLSCSSPSNTPEALTFIWSLEGQSELGQTLPIALGNGHDDITYSCTANNPLQEETSTFKAKDCYTAEGTQEHLSIVLPIVIVSIILLVVGVFFIIYSASK
ncbi:signaling lymphocytic activation molecule-like [Boleophthalmus pectinirostris]|uniref:signaling lymphocytic activation molecule-like n=1 Tax=Boleophthalmus pectinirostris TaxID=150288 RepID=UPI00242BEDAF|nr:signaling lymphocytic activation molecule-like [Boleophthalmus pectinirostris]